MTQPLKWTVTDVADRFEEAVYTLKRLPPVRARGYFNVYPDVVRTTMEILQGDTLPYRPGPPQPDAISRMEETLEWMFLLDEEIERKIIWLRAARVPWRPICRRFGFGRTKGWQLWAGALIKIMAHLNAKMEGR